MDTTEIHIRIKNLTKRFGHVVAVDNISMKIERGSFTTFLGPSGCGKTTTLRLIAGLYNVDQGEIYFGERCVNEVPSHQRNATMVFQDYALFPHMTIFEKARAFLAERFKQRDSVILLARQHGVAVGFVQLYPSLSSVALRRIWILNDLYVAPGTRGQGAGRRLMDRARELAQTTGAVRLELTTERANKTAQALYEKCGYARDDVFYKYVLTVRTEI